jgi:hypothetical protein
VPKWGMGTVMVNETICEIRGTGGDIYGGRSLNAYLLDKECCTRRDCRRPEGVVAFGLELRWCNLLLLGYFDKG